MRRFWVNVGGGVTQMQLADVTGLTAVHVNRTLQGLRRDGLVDVKHNARTLQLALKKSVEVSIETMGVSPY